MSQALAKTGYETDREARLRHRRETYAATVARKAAEAEVARARRHQTLVAALQTGGARLVDLSPSIALGVSAAVMIEDTQQLAGLLLLPLMPLAGFEVTIPGGGRIGFSVDAVEVKLVYELDRIFGTGSFGTGGGSGGFSHKIPAMKRAALGAMVAFLAQVAREVVQTMGRTVVDLGKAVA